MGGGGAVRPSLAFFLPFTQNYHAVPIPDLANLFVANAPMKKKIYKLNFTPLAEHFEIWV